MQFSASGVDTLLGSMQTPVECVVIVLRVCLAMELICSDDGAVLYNSGVYCMCVLLSLRGVAHVFV